jgi:hypothetical protein
MRVLLVEPIFGLLVHQPPPACTAATQVHLVPFDVIYTLASDASTMVLCGWAIVVATIQCDVHTSNIDTTAPSAMVPSILMASPIPTISSLRSIVTDHKGANMVTIVGLTFDFDSATFQVNKCWL